ncbi:hypothetical protein [Corynebacterium sp. NML120713]|uniref:hypothetical protein n=1 Tax=Corynebacterium sp. NML120713 TaxID=1906332 RepID=UPI0008FBA71D|nr:hypothetical protein [Corynebacterium sp. NML120713]OIR43169.1 hypothetical protein BJP06_06205 [Corynebacterium sp. NML120713]
MSNSATHPARLEARRRAVSLLIFEVLSITLFVWGVKIAWEVDPVILVVLALPTLFALGMVIGVSLLVEAEEIIKLYRRADEQEYKTKKKEG